MWRSSRRAVCRGTAAAGSSLADAPVLLPCQHRGCSLPPGAGRQLAGCRSPATLNTLVFQDLGGKRDAPSPGNCRSGSGRPCVPHSWWEMPSAAQRRLQEKHPSCLGEGRARLLSALAKFLGFGKLISLDEQLELDLAPAPLDGCAFPSPTLPTGVLGFYSRNHQGWECSEGWKKSGMTVGEGGHRWEGHLQGAGSWTFGQILLLEISRVAGDGQPRFRAHRNLPSSSERTQKSPARVPERPSNLQQSRRCHNTNNNNSNDHWMKVCCHELAAAQSCLIDSIFL